MSDVVPGLSEALITEGLGRKRSTVDAGLVQRAALADEEAARIFAAHVATVIERALAGVGSETGQRYINHRRLGSSVHLFLRETKSQDNDLGFPPYFYAGTLQYENHSGDRPIRIMWRLDQPLPIDVLQSARLAS